MERTWICKELITFVTRQHGKIERLLYVPKIVIREKKKNKWFDRRCELTRLEREKNMEQVEEKRRKKLMGEIHKNKNEYVKFRREEESNFERNIIKNGKN